MKSKIYLPDMEDAADIPRWAQGRMFRSIDGTHGIMIGSTVDTNTIAVCRIETNGTAGVFFNVSLSYLSNYRLGRQEMQCFEAWKDVFWIGGHGDTSHGLSSVVQDVVSFNARTPPQRNTEKDTQAFRKALLFPTFTPFSKALTRLASGEVVGCALSSRIALISTHEYVSPLLVYYSKVCGHVNEDLVPKLEPPFSFLSSLVNKLCLK